MEELSSSLEILGSLGEISEGGEAFSSSSELLEASGLSSCSESSSERRAPEPEEGNPDGPGAAARRRGRGKKGPGTGTQVSSDDLRHIPR